MTTGPAWQLRGDILEVCSCNVTCPCNVGGDPTKNPCDAIWGLHIQQGSHGSTRLNDQNLALYFRIPGKVFEGNWTLGACLDQRATPQQVEALGAILSGKAGGVFGALAGLIGKALAPRQGAVSFEKKDGNARVAVPGLLEAGSERIPNPMPGQPPLDSKISGLLVPVFAGQVSVRRGTVMKSSDPDLKFEYRGSSSVIGNFDLKGP